MAYERYKKALTKEEFFKEWEKKKIEALTEKLKEYIYNKHINKCRMLQRDDFTCQNYNCTYCKNIKYFPQLTAHHIKFKKNDGGETVRNQVTICRGSHEGFHKAKCMLVFNESETLPPHIKGHTFKLERPDKVNWKIIKAEMKKIRTGLKLTLGEKIKEIPVGQRIWYKLTWEQIYILMSWLTMPYGEDDD